MGSQMVASRSREISVTSTSASEMLLNIAREEGKREEGVRGKEERGGHTSVLNNNETSTAADEVVVGGWKDDVHGSFRILVAFVLIPKPRSIPHLHAGLHFRCDFNIGKR